jgi:phenylacetaldehyde dehydrogenase
MSVQLAAVSHPRFRESMLIDGKWVAAQSGETIAVINPADERQIATVPAGDAADVNAAVVAARRAFSDGRWSGLLPRERARMLNRLADLIDANAKDLGWVETLDNGMPLGQATAGHVPGAAATFRYYASWCDKLDGKTTNLSGNGVEYHAFTQLEPVGVVGIITPWNAPIITAAKLAPALAAGCCCILKPAEDTPLTALLLGELMMEAGIPDGVVNIVTGYGATAGAALAGHPGVDKIAFTGSTATGRAVIASSAGNFKKVSLELGGKSPVIVMDDADMDIAIAGAANAVFANAGQICSAGTRLYVQAKSFDRVVAGIAEIAGKIRLGDGMDPATEMGPVVSQRQLERVTGMIEAGVAEGAEVVVGGGRHGDTGYFVKPTVFVNTRPEMKVVKEEIFGPVLVAAPFDDVADIPLLANDSDYGLAAAIFTRDLSTGHRFARQVRAGTVWMNTYHFVDVSMPWGGYKQSGWGRENGFDGLLPYLQTKSVVVAL